MRVYLMNSHCRWSGPIPAGLLGTTQPNHCGCLMGPLGWITQELSFGGCVIVVSFALGGGQESGMFLHFHHAVYFASPFASFL
jgi:hypothetical protein